ncbi:hypothetical protein C9J52_20785 [Photobacterium iliopiscarium]|uniref:Uncharacterized protein n=1 Tax=Photobacterium iliopiscarium TaxID=56192 RepID=A0ABX5GLR3_9GAMM|nr:hypothetical protein C9J52_20785 [Photobacterium iliopiscarium]
MVIRSSTLHSRKLFLLNFKRKKSPQLLAGFSIWLHSTELEPVIHELIVRQASNKKEPTELRGNCLE